MNQAEQAMRAAAGIVAHILELHYPIQGDGGTVLCNHCHATLNSVNLRADFPCPTVELIYAGTPNV